eukprot:3184791-Rhodomonas_salina.2
MVAVYLAGTDVVVWRPGLHSLCKVGARAEVHGQVSDLSTDVLCGCQTYGFGTYQPPVPICHDPPTPSPVLIWAFCYQKMDPELCTAGMECSSGRREGGRSPKAYRYFDSSDERPWAYGHKWNRSAARRLRRVFGWRVCR